ncbi:Ig-like domain-containing protein [Hymenobacter sp. BT664]|uniref:Ig-like domain-containing protein n=1 Tax=Hymenobacter montanus TaxID=2771359 RepID=A0A927BBI7_9BACT|nr:Ig-like domain-containing protein [Hymenobacter montanus]MBD2767134.1 Ig-like domain-containing protein [Hymenobacter montanus]
MLIIPGMSRARNLLLDSGFTAGNASLASASMPAAVPEVAPAAHDGATENDAPDSRSPLSPDRHLTGTGTSRSVAGAFADVADVTTTLVGNTTRPSQFGTPVASTLGGGLPSGAYTVTFTNNGPNSAENVTRQVTLPVYASMTAAQQAALSGVATYNASNYTITFTTLAVMPSGSSNTYTFSFTAPSTANGNFYLMSSTVGTSTSQGSNTALDYATLSVSVTNPTFIITEDDTNDVPRNTAKTGNVTLNDANPANQAINAQLISQPAHGTVVLNQNGSYTYTPVTGYLGPDSFTYDIVTNRFSNSSTVRLNVYDADLVCILGTGSNLLTNPSFTSGNTGFSSSYTYRPTSTPFNGNDLPAASYMVGGNAASYHSLFVGTGRTGPSDNFMMVNGSQNLSIIYAQTVPVRPNTYYSFSAYASSLYSQNPAQLGFVINGKSTSSVTTLPTTQNNYVRISDLWFSGTQTSAVVEIRDVNKSIEGNDFGIDDLYIGTCTVLLVANNVNNASLSNQSPALAVSPLSATILNGSAVNFFTIQTLPPTASGTLYLNNSPVTVGQTIPVALANQLKFDPQSSYAGDAVFTYSATDLSGSGSNIATFTIPITKTPLPVELVSFEARAGRNLDAQLTWRTASEKNNAHFDVERSTDGQDFTRVGRVAGQGTTIRSTAYAYTDANAGAGRKGTVYYRLRQVNTDGKASYSPVETVPFTGPQALGFHPSPTTGAGALDLSALPSGEYQVTLLDAIGRQVLNTSLAGAQIHSMSLAHVARGTYLLMVRGPGIKLSQRVVRE